jgi:hypothetical protein
VAPFAYENVDVKHQLGAAFTPGFLLLISSFILVVLQCNFILILNC